MMRYAVQVDGAPQTVPAGATAFSVLRNHPTPNTDYTIDDVVTNIGRPLTAREEDLLDLLHAIHIADLICARGRNENWQRDISLAVRLRDPAPFIGLRPLLHEVFGMMTFDRLNISFVPFDQRPAQRYPSTGRGADPPDAVALLSGGIDSAAAGADLATEFERPLFVSARSSSHVSAAQNHAIAALKKINGDLQVVHFRSQPKHQHALTPLPQSDTSQRSRTLLYIGIAATIAGAHSLDRVVLGENGIMAINCPLTLGRVAGFSTRTAHPDVLSRMETIFSSVLGTQLQIANPLLPFTKAEVVKALANQCGAALIRRLHSCWIARQAHHCGHCVPCLVRRFATEAAGITDVTYADDAFNRPGVLTDESFASVGDYLLYVRKLRTASDEDLLFDFPDLNVGSAVTSVDDLIKLHRKWAKQVEGVIKRYPQLRTLYN